ncbi:serine/threonine protein kinase [Mycobacterium mantenii]|uniref:serine/threonine-protein kinase n=1 Tax=Mycobacterium mantenii TaxID=560555 RepID=UPI000800B98F|nr:serine/threonine-protein kinase [Mycobacterium mantenii]OBH59669.1 serine/threonine protein kinase [Mycobacterium mantenii]
MERGEGAVSLVGSKFGKYEIKQLLGEGGMGEVYAAYDAAKGRTVALKVLTDRYAHDEEFRMRFLRECRVAATLEEPHVVPIHDWGEIDGNLYIDMRLVKGETLHDLLQKGALEPQRAADIVGQVASALDAAHALGLIHRDVKPQNILITPDDFAYLLDFGIAAAAGETQLTNVGYHIGSFEYMAPERFDDDDATPAADVYSLACVLYQMLTGAIPFPVRTAQQAVKAHTLTTPPRPSDVNPSVPRSFDEVIARGMAKHPDDRYGSAGALGRAAKRALSELPAAPAPAPVPSPGAAATTADAAATTRFSLLNEPPPVFSNQTFEAQNAPPAATPTVAAEAGGRSSRQLVIVAASAIAVALLVVGVGVGVGLVVTRNSSPQSSPPTVAAPPSGATNYQEPSSPPTQQYPTQQAQVPSTVTLQVPTTVTAAPPSPVVPATLDPALQLRQIANDDRSFVSAQLADWWVPQLSSKRPGVRDNGIVWDNASTLQEHLQLRQRYPDVRLLWSGDWSTFSAPDFWVTIAGIRFPDSAGALAWCRYQGFDRDHCAAKLVSTTHREPGSTAYN